jgi:17beta-estradiol 17-dehydrogenase / very-long-chain 3-oxoacyl-CoA reductase
MTVNNVGKSHTMPTYFAETMDQENEDIVTINVAGTVRVTRAVLPGMIQRSVIPLFAYTTTDREVDHRKRGLILNVGSFAGQVASPMLATYSGTKAFVSTFTCALAEEVRAHNIVVQNLNTYFVVCVSTIPYLLHAHAISGLENVQNQQVVDVGTHTHSLRSLRVE